MACKHNTLVSASQSAQTVRNKQTKYMSGVISSLAKQVRAQPCPSWATGQHVVNQHIPTGSSAGQVEDHLRLPANLKSIETSLLS